jgi:hypothetical protein
MKKLFIIVGFLVFCLTMVWLIVWWNSPERQRAKLIVESRKAWTTPIQFFGKVVDEHGNPVEGATVRFQVTDLSATGVSEYHTKSDIAGLFTLTNVTGKHLGVFVSREGYYTSKTNRTAFEYAAGGGQHGIFVPDSQHPVVFQLRKQGEKTNVVKKGGNFRLPLDGTPVELDLINCKEVPVGTGHISVQCWVSDLSMSYGFTWRWRISVREGGLQEALGEFLFEAPEMGYEPFEEGQITMEAKPWRNSVDRRYFLKLADGRFVLARIVLKTKGTPPYFYVEYYFNTSGSRNLEHDPRGRAHWGDP